MNIKTFYEASVNDGLENIFISELRHRFGSQVQVLHKPEQYPGSVQFTYSGSILHLFKLKTVLSLFAVHQIPVPRPRALMGHQHFQYLLQQIQAIRKLSPKDAFKTVYLAAAGSESSVMTRFIDELAQNIGLTVASDEGDLLIRLRRPLDNPEAGWDVMIRMSPRPLSVREWRVCDYRGALNAAAAHAMAMLTLPNAEDVVLNIACGSGSILIERAALAPFKMAIGCDINEEALRCARANVAAAHLATRIQLTPWDARALPLPDASVDVICADLPFGHHIGSHHENTTLYPQIMAEVVRVLKPKGRCVFLTHEVRLMTNLLERSAEWATESITPITLNGLHPRIFVLKKKARE